jgi:hypothetical protein
VDRITLPNGIIIETFKSEEAGIYLDLPNMYKAIKKLVVNIGSDISSLGAERVIKKYGLRQFNTRSLKAFADSKAVSKNPKLQKAVKDAIAKIVKERRAKVVNTAKKIGTGVAIAGIGAGGMVIGHKASEKKKA